MEDTVNFSIIEVLLFCIFAGITLIILPLKVMEKDISHPCIEWEEEKEICNSEVSCIGLFHIRCSEEQYCYLNPRKCIQKK